MIAPTAVISAVTAVVEAVMAAVSSVIPSPYSNGPRYGPSDVMVDDITPALDARALRMSRRLVTS